MRRPTLVDVVDLETRLRSDAELTPGELHERDGAIGARIGARDLDDREAVLAWLAALRGDASIGTRAALRRSQLVAVLAVAGFALGAVTVGGWLATSAGRPINVIYFWPAFVGSQILFALAWWWTVVPARLIERVPILGALHGLMRQASAFVPRVVGKLLARRSDDQAGAFRLALTEMKRLDWLYGRIRFWLLAQLGQGFAVAFNVGALAAFVVLPTIDDPAFGWRSRLLDAHDVAMVSRLVATPWRVAWPDALPSATEIGATRYSSVAPHYAGAPDANLGGTDAATRPRDAAPWDAWWPFLLASLVTYGLTPRLLHWLIATLRLREAFADLPFDRAEIARLCERMRRPRVATGALDPELAAEPGGSFDASPHPVRIDRAIALHWPGVMRGDGEPALRDALAQQLAARFGARPESMWPVGDVGRAADRTALVAVAEAAAGTGIYMLVESWEPPVGDYIDLLGAVRQAGGDRRPIVVVLHARGRDGGSAPAQPGHVAVWRRRLARLADPWLFVEPMVAAAAEQAS